MDEKQRKSSTTGRGPTVKKRIPKWHACLLFKKERPLASTKPLKGPGCGQISGKIFRGDAFEMESFKGNVSNMM